ncbi:hypothetical protein [Sphingomonas sp.]|uniref:hypothetical protein n=1 Tax=Sphingomonas sp. TaxID=28214 RepID=UPI003F7D1592
MLIVALVLQAAASPGNRPILPGGDLDSFDLAKTKPKDRDATCGADDPNGDIVVCARNKVMDIDTSRMPEFSEKPVRTTVDLPGGAKAGVGTTARNVGGFPSNAVMAKVKIPF